MRRVIFESSISIDGFVEGPNGELDWLNVKADVAADPVEFLSVFDTIFYGRKAYEKIGIASITASQLRPDEKEFYCLLHGMRKYVFSRTATHVGGNAMVVRENLESEVRRIRDEDGKDIWFCGGPDVLRTFAALDLVDEYILTVHPIELHNGKPLFERNQKPVNLILTEKRDLKKGLVILRYQPESRLKVRSHGGRSFQNKY